MARERGAERLCPPTTFPTGARSAERFPCNPLKMPRSVPPALSASPPVLMALLLCWFRGWRWRAAGCNKVIFLGRHLAPRRPHSHAVKTLGKKRIGHACPLVGGRTRRSLPRSAGTGSISDCVEVARGFGDLAVRSLQRQPLRHSGRGGVQNSQHSCAWPSSCVTTRLADARNSLPSVAVGTQRSHEQLVSCSRSF